VNNQTTVERSIYYYASQDEDGRSFHPNKTCGEIRLLLLGTYNDVLLLVEGWGASLLRSTTSRFGYEDVSCAQSKWLERYRSALALFDPNCKQRRKGMGRRGANGRGVSNTTSNAIQGTRTKIYDCTFLDEDNE